MELLKLQWLLLYKWAKIGKNEQCVEQSQLTVRWVDTYLEWTTKITVNEQWMYRIQLDKRFSKTQEMWKIILRSDIYNCTTVTN